VIVGVIVGVIVRRHAEIYPIINPIPASLNLTLQWNPRPVQTESKPVWWNVRLIRFQSKMSPHWIGLNPDCSSLDLSTPGPLRTLVPALPPGHLKNSRGREMKCPTRREIPGSTEVPSSLVPWQTLNPNIEQTSSAHYLPTNHLGTGTTNPMMILP